MVSTLEGLPDQLILPLQVYAHPKQQHACRKGELVCSLMVLTLMEHSYSVNVYPLAKSFSQC